MTPPSNVIPFPARPLALTLRRPGTLIRAARAGQRGWQRDRDLMRLLRMDRCPRAGAALPRLRAEEEIQNELRRKRATEYDLHRHVLLMIALLAEMRAALDAVPAPLAVAR